MCRKRIGKFECVTKCNQRLRQKLDWESRSEMGPHVQRRGEGLLPEQDVERGADPVRGAEDVGRDRAPGRGAGVPERGAQGDARRPKSRRPGEALEQAEGRVGREVAQGLRVPPEGGAGLHADIEELPRVREARSREARGR